MVKQLIIKIAYKAIEDKMLKIYAIAMSILFFSAWTPIMVYSARQLIKIWFGV
tara:strand:- start:623 stop:781 length:159 start_codon:yes stop_codon:yes gene_type:complete